MIDYRLAKSSDATELKKLNDLFNGEGSNTAEAIAASLETNAQEIVCVAADGSRLVGYCCGQVMKSMCYSYDYAEITEFYVTEEYRRQGIGRRLFIFTDNEFYKRGITHFHIATGHDNTAAQTLYRSCGYVETAIMLEKGPQH